MTTLLERMNDYYWYGPNPEYSFHHSYSIQPRSLQSLRRFFAICQILIVFFTFWNTSVSFLFLFQYLTIWGCVLTTIYFLIAVVITSSNEIEKVCSNTLLWKSAHILFEVVLPMQFLIGLFFWFVLYPIEPSLVHGSFSTILSSVLVHLVTPLFIWIEGYYNGLRIYPRHTWWVLKVLIIYGVVNAYVSLNYQPVYPLMNWKDPISYLLLLVGALLALVGFWVAYRIHLRKEKNSKLLRHWNYLSTAKKMSSESADDTNELKMEKSTF